MEQRIMLAYKRTTKRNQCKRRMLKIEWRKVSRATAKISNQSLLMNQKLKIGLNSKFEFHMNESKLELLSFQHVKSMKESNNPISYPTIEPSIRLYSTGLTFWYNPNPIGAITFILSKVPLNLSFSEFSTHWIALKTSGKSKNKWIVRSIDIEVTQKHIKMDTAHTSTTIKVHASKNVSLTA